MSTRTLFSAMRKENSSNGRGNSKSFFRKKILTWFRKNRRHFFWRKKPSAYTIFVTEVFLKKTSAPYAEKFAESFLREFPSPKHLSEAKVTKLKSFFKKLGLVRRGRDLKKAATQICERHGCRLPKDRGDLKKIHLIGDYTCNAILSFSYGRREPIVDTNVVRIYRRYFGLQPNARAHTDREVWRFAREMLPRKKAEVKNFNWALLDFGALVCKVGRPLCDDCPLKRHCEYYRKSFPKHVIT